jgi:pheromone shutdown protein TraB
LSRRNWISSTITTAAGVSLFPLPSFAKPKIKTSDAICDQAVSILQRKDRLLYVLGTAHISDVSAQLAQQLIRDVKPDAVFIELDLKRVGGLPFNKIQRKKDRIEIPGPSNSTVIVPNIIPVSKSMQFSQSEQQTVLASLMDAIDFGASDEYNEALASLLIGNPAGGISQMYSNLSKQGFKPGQEFIVAVQEGQKIGADIVLGDQDMGVTLQRLAQAAQMTDFSKMENTNSQFEQAMKELAPEESGDYKTNLSSFVENLKTRENVSKIMNELREQAPYMVSAMLDERDAYMAAGLDILEDKPVTCAVLGIAHLDGVERNLKAKGWKITHANCPRK